MTAAEIGDLSAKLTLCAAIGAFLLVYLFGWLSRASLESTFIKGLVALAAVGSLGWVLTLVVSQEGRETPPEEPKGEQIDVTLE